MENINYRNIATALDFYKSYGFTYIETPWVVDQDIIDITCPQERFALKVGDHTSALVGSAEQGFLQLVKDKVLPEGYYVTAGPCFRVEDIIDEYHQSQFFKIELFANVNTEERALIMADALLSAANSFMAKSVVTQEEDGVTDLEIAGIEVGSYGARHHDLVGHWAYGTGLAEPRYSQAMRKYNEQT